MNPPTDRVLVRTFYRVMHEEKTPMGCKFPTFETAEFFRMKVLPKYLRKTTRVVEFTLWRRELK